MLEDQISKSQTKINMHNSINYRALLLELEQQLAANIVREREIATRTDAALLELEDDNDSTSDSDTDSAHRGGARCANCTH
jgi:outer membrane lipopolysaccharide assembly protein LptE/RlpB